MQVGVNRKRQEDQETIFGCLAHVAREGDAPYTNKSDDELPILNPGTNVHVGPLVRQEEGTNTDQYQAAAPMLAAVMSTVVLPIAQLGYR